MSKKKSGYTLIEVIITMAIFSMVMTSVFVIYVKGIGYSQKGELETMEFRKPAIVFEKISQELMCKAEVIKYPTSEELSLNGSNSIVFTTFENSTPSETIGYIFDSVESKLKRVLYSSDFDPYNPSASTPISIKAILSNVKNISFKKTWNGLLSISMTVAGSKREYLLKTKVYVKN